MTEQRLHNMTRQRQEFLAEWEHTWVRHHGYVTAAAPIFDTTPQALARRLYRAKRDNYPVRFVDDTKALRA
jgi:hypothetical protein